MIRIEKSINASELNEIIRNNPNESIRVDEGVCIFGDEGITITIGG